MVCRSLIRCCTCVEMKKRSEDGVSVAGNQLSVLPGNTKCEAGKSKPEMNRSSSTTVDVQVVSPVTT